MSSLLSMWQSSTVCPELSRAGARDNHRSKHSQTHSCLLICLSSIVSIFWESRLLSDRSLHPGKLSKVVLKGQLLRQCFSLDKPLLWLSRFTLLRCVRVKASKESLKTVALWMLANSLTSQPSQRKGHHQTQTLQHLLSLFPFLHQRQKS